MELGVEQATSCAHRAESSQQQFAAQALTDPATGVAERAHERNSLDRARGRRDDVGERLRAHVREVLDVERGLVERVVHALREQALRRRHVVGERAVALVRRLDLRERFRLQLDRLHKFEVQHEQTARTHFAEDLLHEHRDLFVRLGVAAQTHAGVLARRVKQDIGHQARDVSNRRHRDLAIN